MVELTRLAPVVLLGKMLAVFFVGPLVDPGDHLGEGADPHGESKAVAQLQDLAAVIIAQSLFFPQPVPAPRFLAFSAQ
jgi:hypothetical protein